MATTDAPALSLAAGRSRLTLVTASRRPQAERQSAVRRALDARRTLIPRSERFAHLKRMHD